MANLMGFDATKHEPSTGDFEPLPVGEYMAVITASEMKTTRAGDGEYLALTFQVIDGPHKGRNLWSNLNLKNPSEKAVQIAHGELSAICRAVGVLTPRDSAELHNIPLIVKVKIEARKDTGEQTNRITSYKARVNHQAVSTAAAAPGAPAAHPWKKA